jgi:hypothetical protein
MIVVPDTCIINVDFHLASISFQLIFDNHHLTGYTVAVPEVVVQETVNHFREKVSEETSRIVSSTRTLGKYLGKKLAAPKVDQAAELSQYETSLRHRLQLAGSCILPLPSATHQQLLARELKRRKPFNANGKGHRDALIWETILEYAGKHPSERIAFVTSNVNDFCDKDKLHPDLVQDLKDGGLPADHVTVFTALQAFVDMEVMPRLPTPHKTFVEYTSANCPAFRLSDSLLRLMEDKLQHKEVDEGDLGLPQYYENPTIRGIYEPTDIEILSEHRTKEKQRVIEIRASVECQLDAYIDKSEYGCFDPDHRPYAEDWNETFMEADFEEVLEIEAYTTFDEKEGDLVDLEVTDIRGTRDTFER